MWVIIDGSIRAIYIYIYYIYIYVTCVTNHLQSPRNRRRVDSRPAATFAQRRLAVPKTRSVGWLGCKLSSCPLLCLPTGCSILCHLWLMCRACDTSAGDFSPPLTRESWKLLGGLEIVNLHFFLPYTQVIAFFFSPFNMFSSGNHDQSSNWGVPSFQTLLGVQGHSKYEDKRKLQAKGIASVGARVMNLREARLLVEAFDQKWAVTKQKMLWWVG